jgi:hypothetical protein
MKYFYITLLFVFIFVSLSAQDNDSKSGYHLFNPTPRDKMREFSIDRPDVTESPSTVDAGHFQFEGDIFKWLKNSRRNSEGTMFLWNGLYKLGLANKLDIHIGVELYNIEMDEEGNAGYKGYGNTTIRLKYNFWGNEGDTKTALGIIPYVKLPTSKVSDQLQFGAGFPFSYGLTEKLDLGLQFQGDFFENGLNGYDFSYLQTIVIGGALVGDLDFYTEIAAVFSADDPIFTLNGGLIYNVTPSLKIDIAGNYGLVDQAYSTAFVGLSFRY